MPDGAISIRSAEGLEVSGYSLPQECRKHLIRLAGNLAARGFAYQALVNLGGDRYGHLAKSPFLPIGRIGIDQCLLHGHLPVSNQSVDLVRTSAVETHSFDASDPDKLQRDVVLSIALICQRD